jgi:glucose/arabinose dehydrogenase
MKRLAKFPSGLFLVLILGPLFSTARAQQSAPPDQAHAMMDVGYQFANLWFAGDKENWPLAEYFLNETRQHLQWAVAIKPVRKTKAGDDVDLNGILGAITNTILPEVEKAIQAKDSAAFKNAYRQTITGCYACHVASEKPFLRVQIPDAPGASVINFSETEVAGEAGPGDAASRGRAFFQQNCALCHATGLGPRNTAVGGQGPSLAGVVGRRAASSPGFNYTKALTDSRITWDTSTLDHFIANPIAAVPGTTMLISVPDETNRRNLIAFLSTLAAPAPSSQGAEAAPALSAEEDSGSWLHQAPGVKHHITVADLPAPFATSSAGNGPQVVKRPEGAELSVPAGFTVKPFQTGLGGSRLLRIAPNGDIFLAETGRNDIRVLRAADGAEAPSQNEVFAEKLDRPFGLAFYPPGKNPEWIYVANNNSVVRLPYHNGDLKATGEAQVIVPKLADTTGGHSTRDVAFSKNGKRMFISDGSGSNVAEEMDKKDPDFIKQWEAEHGFGATWGPETHRAQVLVTDPEGKNPLTAFATGIRNPVSLAVNDVTGDVWVSINERDGLGDNLVPDYITRVKEGGYYGWPWYYIGNHEDPRHAGERPDLAGKAIVPDILLQSHSASLEMTFYTAKKGVAAFPKEYRGDVFACEHGSWNRNNRTGYKVIHAKVENGIPTGEYEDFLTGFVVDNHSVWGRPVGVAVAHDGALLVNEDGNGVLWRIAYTGSK